MANDVNPTCEVCLSTFRYEVEEAYLEGARVPGSFTRQQVERHMSHTHDADTLRLVAGLADAGAVAARLRSLEVAAMTLLDMAIRQEDGKLAIAAIREARSTLQAMHTLTGTLATRGSAEGDRADLDQQIADYVATGGRVAGSAEGPQEGHTSATDVPGAPRRGQRQALRGPTLALTQGD